MNFLQTLQALMLQYLKEFHIDFTGIDAVVSKNFLGYLQKIPIVYKKKTPSFPCLFQFSIYTRQMRTCGHFYILLLNFVLNLSKCNGKHSVEVPSSFLSNFTRIGFNKCPELQTATNKSGPTGYFEEWSPQGSPWHHQL